MREGNGEGDGAGDLGGGSIEMTRNLQKKGGSERSEREVGTDGEENEGQLPTTVPRKEKPARWAIR
jgi:hypothetical protein